MMNGTEVKVEVYEEVIGDLNYAASVEDGQNAGSFQEPTLSQNISSLTPQNRPTLRSSSMSLAGDTEESIPKVVIYSYSNVQCWYLSITMTHYLTFFIIISPSILPYIIMRHARRMDFICLM